MTNIEKLKELGVYKRFCANYTNDDTPSKSKAGLSAREYCQKFSTKPFFAFIAQAFQWALSTEGLQFWYKVATHVFKDDVNENI